MEKPAPVANPIAEVLRRRWSPRAFSVRAVTDAQLCSLLEAARWAPSSSNEQPWRFLVTRHGTEGFDRLLGCLTDGNIRWVKYAPVLMMSFAHTIFSRNGRENRHAFHDTGLASMAMAVQATTMDMAIHMMAGYHRERMREAYQLPDEIEPVAAIALGHLGGDPDMLAENLPERERQPRVRRELAAFVFEDAWGRTPSFLEP